MSRVASGNTLASYEVISLPDASETPTTEELKGSSDASRPNLRGKGGDSAELLTSRQPQPSSKGYPKKEPRKYGGFNPTRPPPPVPAYARNWRDVAREMGDPLEGIRGGPADPSEPYDEQKELMKLIRAREKIDAIAEGAKKEGVDPSKEPYIK